MDDQGFDDIIKRKVGEYEDPKFDTSSLTDLHNRMATLKYAPWYSHYKTELMISASILLSTLVMLSGLWLMNNHQTTALEEKQIYIQSQKDEIAKLKDEISYLKNLPPDTIRIVQFKEQTPPTDTHVLKRIAELESTIIRLEALYKTKSAYEENLSFAADTAGSGYLSNESYESPFVLLSNRLTPIESELKSLRAEPKPISNGNEATSAFFSVKTTRELEKHYRRGIGIRLGPVLELSKGFYSSGAGGIDITGGLLGDLILSPSMSLETGGKFIHRFYEIGDDEISAMNSKLPYVNADLAPVTQVDIDSWMIEIPFNLKYRYPLSSTSHALAGFGYSSLLYTKQVLEYSYNLDTVTSGYITEPHTISKYTWYTGTLNISLGLSKRLKNNKILETSLYYQHGLGESGVEKTKSNFLGIRGTYWFTIKR
jgi:uncharacterized small protein (DUF1192 family)